MASIWHTAESSVCFVINSIVCTLLEFNLGLSFHVADLTKDEGWAEAVHGCKYVLHVASPFLSGTIAPADAERLLIGPAREGTLRVLRAARDDGQVKRFVFTSSFAAVGYGHS